MARRTERETAGTKWAASLLCVSLETCRQWAASGKIPARKVGIKWIFNRAELRAWLAKQGNGR